MKGKCVFIIMILLASYTADTILNNSFSELDEIEILFAQEGDFLVNSSSLAAWGNVTVSAGNAIAYGVISDSDDNLYVVGKQAASFAIDGQWINRTGSGTGVFLLKFLPNGTLAWGINGASNGDSSVSNVATGPNGSVYITGNVDGIITFENTSSSNHHGMFVAKFSSNGEFLWINTGATGAAYLGGTDIVVDSYGAAYITGYTTVGTSGYVAKIDNNGTWLYTTDNRYEVGGSGSMGLILDADGFLFVSFSNWNSGVGLTTVKKLNSSTLQVIWSQNIDSGTSLTTYGVCAEQVGRCPAGGGISVNNYGEIVVTGTTKISTNGGWIPYVSKLDANGTQLWFTKLPITASNSYPTNVILDSNGNSIVSGYIDGGNILGSQPNGNTDIFVAQLNTSGVLDVGKSYGGPQDEMLYDSTLTIDGRLVVVGSTSGSGNYGSNIINVAQTSMFIGNFQKDYDQDGIGNSVDIDVDGDGVENTNDNCKYSPIYFISSGGTDHDSDGCKDDSEDNDDDNDGILDQNDSCPSGTIAWVPTNFTDQDNDGCQDSSEDLDDDADGYLDQEDQCPKTFGNSSVFGDLGCVDSDGDGRSDFNDQFPDDATEWQDSDMDQVGDNSDPFELDASQWEDADGDGHGDNPYGTLGDKFPLDPERWQDSDDDGYADEDDLFPNEKSQWADQDGDGYGDNALGDRADAFPEDSTEWLDSDFDGLGDNSDQFPYDVSQQYDSDGDGYGDAEDGNRADRFPSDPTQWSDIDYDGYGDNPNGTNPDAFPTDATQWSDSDGDGYGDNPTGRLYDQFPDNPTQWEDYDGDGLGDNQNGTDADPFLNDLDNDGFNDTVDLLPRFASPGDMDADGCLDVDDLFPEDSRECSDFDGDGEGDNTDVDDDNDGWADTDELRQGTDPFDASSKPVDGFEIIIPGTEISLGAWDLIGIFGGVPLFVWIGFGFVTRNGRTARYEEKLRSANTRDELEQVAKQWEYSLMLRMLGPHQGIRLERLRAELDDKFEAMNQTFSSIDGHDFDQTQMVVAEMNDSEKQVPEINSQSDYPLIEDLAHKTDDNGYEWFIAQDGTNFYRTIGSQADWTMLEN